MIQKKVFLTLGQNKTSLIASLIASTKTMKKTISSLLLLPLICLPAHSNPNNIGSYVGVSVTRNKQGVDSAPRSYDRNSSVTGATIQSRFPLADLGDQFTFSTRPYFAASPAADGSTGYGLGNVFTVDVPLARTQQGSKANIYVGAGYQVGLTGGLSSYQAATSSQFVFSAGIEGRLSKNFVGFIDFKFPTTRTEGAAYSTVMSTGIGIKF